MYVSLVSSVCIDGQRSWPPCSWHLTLQRALKPFINNSIFSNIFCQYKMNQDCECFFIWPLSFLINPVASCVMTYEYLIVFLI